MADNVYAHIQPDGGWCLNNAGILVAGGRTLLVDTAATERRTLMLRDSLAAVAGEEPEVLVNTHHHSDHTFGNSLFGPRTLVVAHHDTREESRAAGLGLQSLWPDVVWGAVSVRLPDLGYQDALTLHLGPLRVELIHVGPAHTTNDTVVWVPERGVLFTGDVVMSGVTPYTLMGSVEGSLTALERLRALRPRVVVPGHGPVAGPEVIDTNLAYLRWVRDLATESAAAGLTPLQAARQTDLGPFAELLDAERLVSNLHRARADAAGAGAFGPEDILSSFQEMTEYHGGLPACHA
ncbi:MBL fold metallo-hydrolase [Candidatus Protofrankia californiensis]|uniref:MBL fold metallo-hydrolase n=1 Tax=Candidatus Protofrankia californiensis TaxID=1839754 RepID=UPI0010414109|nr:MBL fold metallo-hydrolase [Candidatus Protofrankia californiensis]